MGKRAVAENIEVWPLDKIKPYWRNPRKIDRKAIEAVKASIAEYGYVQPIVVDAEGIIVIGHVRYRALQELKVKEVQVIVADLPEEKIKSLRLVDNRVGELSRWDEDKLFQELAELVGEATEVTAFFPEFDLPDVDAIVDTLGDIGADLVQAQEGESAGSDDDPYSVSNADIVNAEVKLETAPASQKPADHTVQVTCPHCGEEFGVDVKRLMLILESQKQR